METAVVIRGETDLQRGLSHGTSGEAEWLALLAAIDIARQRGERDIILIGDSRSVIRQASGAEPCRSGIARCWLTRFLDEARHFDRVRLRHVKRSQNLAGAALEKARWQRIAPIPAAR